MSNYNDYNKENMDCTAYTYQSATVSVPIGVKPEVDIGNINTFCCGEPKVTPSPYKIICCKEESCDFILTQNVCIEIPVKFSAKAFKGCTRTKCGNVSTEMCEDCGG